MIVPICEWHPIDDGWGIVGYRWTCTECKAQSSFVVPYIGEIYTCNKCQTDHLSNFEEL